MRNAFILTTLWLAAALIPARGMELSEAFGMPGLRVEIAGADSGDRDIAVRVWNHGKSPVTISAATGFVLAPEDESYQDMILTEPLELFVEAGDQAETTVYAMCIQASDRSPSSSTLFAPSRYADAPLRDLAAFIHAQNFQDISGQEAMWTVSDGRSLYDIGGPAARVNGLRQFVADLIGEAFDTALVNSDADYVERFIKEYALFLNFNLTERSDIRLQLFNHKGEWVRDLMNHPGSQKGRYDMKYKVSLIGLDGQKYFVRLYVGEDMRTEFTLYIKDS